MSDEAADIRDQRDFFAEPSSMLSDAVRYGLSVAVVLTCGAGLAVATGRSTPDSETAAETDSAVMIDLPADETFSRPAGDAADGPEQQAAKASPAQQTPKTVEPPKPDEPSKPVDVSKLQQPEKPLDVPPFQPDPPAVIEHETRAVTPPPKPATAPPMQAQEELAPASSERPAKTGADDGDAGRPPPSAHAISLWQKSLMKRLEAAKRQVGHEPHADGTVKVAFEIDAKGGLASERVAQSSGSATLDKAALLLVRRAAPFPAPPRNAPNRNTFFIVPIRFR